jgi:hypothetical protein
MRRLSRKILVHGFSSFVLEFNSEGVREFEPRVSYPGEQVGLMILLTLKELKEPNGTLSEQRIMTAD